MAVCTRCGTDNPPGAKFCNECAAPLGEPATREQRKVVTVLFCDVSGSTALGERVDPEALRAIMARYFETARVAIERHGGTVEKFIGDAVMAVFGVPVVHEDDALRALRAALEIRDGVEVDVRIGVNTGEVVTGGADAIATGDTVNVAARLEQSAGAGEVLVGAETYRLVRDAVDTELLPPIAAKGKSEPLTVHRLLAVTGGPRRSTWTLMVGREHELDLLRRAFERTRQEGACHLFTVLGTAGIGKSRLVHEFLSGLDDARVLHGRCLSYGEGITYWPVVEILKQLDTLPEDEAARHILDALLGGEQVPTTAFETAWAVRKTLEQVAHEEPLVVVFDDIQWGEPTFLDLVEHVADLSRGAPILLLCMARPELLDIRPAWGGGKHNATSVLLEPLPPETAEMLVHTLLGDADEALSARITESAAGNPLFVEEMVELVRDSGGDVALPPTIQALLAARLDSLPTEERIVLECGAVEGEVFHRGAVTALEPGDPQIDERLVGLVRKELVRPDTPMIPADDAYRFRHLLIRDAAYEALPKATRIDLHARFAAWLEDRGGDLVELDEIVGYHLEQACRYRGELGMPDDERLAGRALHRLAAAGRRAVLREDHTAAAKLLERAARLAPPRERDLGIEVDLIDALFNAGMLDAAVQRAASGAERAAAEGDTRGALVFRLQELKTKLFAEPEGVSERLYLLAEEAIARFEAAGDDLVLWLAHFGRGGAAHMHVKVDSALEAFERARMHAHRLDAPHREHQLLAWIGACRFNGTTPVREALDWLDAQGPLASSFANRSFRALGEAMAGRIEQARASMASLRAELAERGAPLMQAEYLALADPEFEMLAGTPAAAVELGIEGCARLEEMGERGWLSTGAAQVAQALYSLDRLDEAQMWAEKSKELGASDDVATQMLWRQIEAKLRARRGDAEVAERLAREAVALGAPTDHLDFRAASYLDLGTVLELVGKPDEAAAAFARALELYERKGNVVMASRVRERLSGRLVS